MILSRISALRHHRGSITMNAPSRRKLRGKPYDPAAALFSNPTPERRKMIDGAYVVNNDPGRTIITVRDAPLDRMRDRNAIGGNEYAALQKYKHHWTRAGMAGRMSALDLNGVFSSDKSTRSGMATQEAECHHLKQYRDARALLGHRTGIVVDNIVCAEQSLEIAGYSIGWTNKPQAIAAATEMLRDAGYRLSKLWGMG